MKKFAKLVAVFAALMLAWACFVACSNGDDDNGSDDASVKALQGLWIYEKDVCGQYLEGDTFYHAILDGKTWCYDKDDYDKFSVSGNKITVSYYDEEDDKYHVYLEADFEINGDTLTLKYYDEEGSRRTNTLKKSTEKPKGIQTEKFDEIYDSLSGDSEE